MPRSEYAPSMQLIIDIREHNPMQALKTSRTTRGEHRPLRRLNKYGQGTKFVSQTISSRNKEIEHKNSVRLNFPNISDSIRRRRQAWS
eukprot:6210552-Pleurochrysis_carterae.AAC.1